MTVCRTACLCLRTSDLRLTYRTTPDLPEPKSLTSPTPSLTVPTVSCCLVRLPRVNTPSKLVSHSCVIALIVIPRSYPIVKVMAETSYLAESALAYPSLFDQLRLLTKRPTETAETLAMSAVAASIEQDAGAIIVLSTSGISARFLSKFRPQCPIICGKSSPPYPPFSQRPVHGLS